ncbi:MAG: MarR family transcriptional regulator [Actinomycetaceae bacterium]|nr:MarR family transcriptional regulator [Actinomycetaceae bacterium]
MTNPPSAMLDLGEALRRMAGLTSAQHALLSRIASRSIPVTVTELADEAGLHVSSVRETLDALVAEGLVVSRPLPAAGRGRPSLGYATYVPTDPSFPAQMLTQCASAVVQWLRSSAAEPAISAREIGALWAKTALSAFGVPDHSQHRIASPEFSLPNHMEKIRLFLTALGMAAQPVAAAPTSFLLTACPFTDPDNPDPLALEMRRGLVEGILTLTSAGTADIHFIPDPDSPLRTQVDLIPRPIHGWKPMTISIHFFGGAAEAAGSDVITLEPGDSPTTVGALADSLAQSHPALGPVLGVSSFLVNSASADRDTHIPAGARIDVLPPFAGG